MAASSVLTLVLVLACVAAWPGADAHGYRNKKLKKFIPVEQRYHNHVPVPLLKPHDLPKRFDWRNVNGVNYLVPNWQQHVLQYCGACWVHGSLSMIQDRLKIRKNALGVDVMLGRQTLLNCAAFHGYGNGCDGGDTWDVFRYMTEFGLPDEGCLPYNATDHTKFAGATKCPAEGQCQNCMPVNGVDTCWAIKSYVKYYLTSWGQVEKGEAAMMSEIYQRGPITCGMSCPDDFVWNYKGGIYKDTSGDKELDHDVEVVGWGEEKGVPYWIVRNSWGAYWGELGFFRVERGVNGLQLESGDCWYAVPENRVEEEVEDGKVHGSMWGLVDNDSDDSVSTAAIRASANLAQKPEQRQQQQEEEEEQLARAEGGVAVSRRMLH